MREAIQAPGLSVCATSAGASEVNDILKSLGFQIDHSLSNVEADRLWFERDSGGQPQAVQHNPLTSCNGFKTRLAAPGSEGTFILAEVIGRLWEAGHTAALGMPIGHSNDVEWKQISLEPESDFE